MENKSMIYKAILGVMSDIGAVGKDQLNKQQNFKFRGIDDVMNALHPALIKNGVFIVPNILEQKLEELSKGVRSMCKIEYTFFAEDGSNIKSIVYGEAIDYGDKATNKSMAIAFKYACFQVFCIPTEEMQDPDSDSPEGKPKPSNGNAPPTDYKCACGYVFEDTLVNGEIWPAAKCYKQAKGACKQCRERDKNE
jgi:hypothetical protein